MKDYEIKRFKRFLKEKGVYKSFQRHFTPEYCNINYIDTHPGNKSNRINTLKEYLNEIDNHLVFLYAFDWRYALEEDGIDDLYFWHKLTVKYLNGFLFLYESGCL